MLYTHTRTGTQHLSTERENEMVTFDQIRSCPEIQQYIRSADKTLEAIGFTEHSHIHVGRCAQITGDLLKQLGYDERMVELSRITAYLHDIGNVVNRVGHAQSGALMAFPLLDKMGMVPEEIAAVITAIGHHDEETAFPVNEIAAALILADKSDVRRSRVRTKGQNGEHLRADIHDRVNYAVEKSDLQLQQEQGSITLDLVIDSAICPVMDYFEIFLGRMLLCRKAANFFELQFQLIINGVSLL